MKLGKKEKIYGLVLGVAAVAFGIDRVFFTPATAEAAAIEHPSAQPARPQAPAAQVPTTSDCTAPVAAGWLASRLRNLPIESDNELHDVFAAPASWRPVQELISAPAPAQAQHEVEQFRRDHRLQAVFITSKGGKAVVDDRLVAVGSSLGDFRLIGLTPKSARFAHGGDVVLLPLMDSAASNVHAE